VARPLSQYDVDWIVTAGRDWVDYFEETVAAGAEPKKTVNFMMREMREFLNKHNIGIAELKARPADLAHLLSMIR